MSDGSSLELMLHPRVPMPYVQSIGPLAALAICEQAGDDAQILWPKSVLLGGKPYARVYVDAGYEEGIYARVSVAFDDVCAEEDADAVAEAIRERFDAWEDAVRAGRAAAGPIAPFASDYFDRMAGLDTTVELLFPNGNVYCTAQLEGIDVWCRICVELDDGRDAEYSPEQVSLRLLPSN